MAHVTIEWSANLAGRLDLQGLMRRIARHLREEAEGAFPVGGIRVRAYCAQDYVIADDAGADDAFLHLAITIGAGRDAAFRQRYFDALFAAVVAFLGDLPERCPLALSLYVAEAEGWKHNTVHRRLKG